MAVAVLVEHAAGKILPQSLSVLGAAMRLGKVTAIVAGARNQALEDAATASAAVDGVDNVLVAASAVLEHGLAEPHSKLLQLLQNSRHFTHVVGASSSYGRNVIPRAAALMGVQPVSDVVEIIDKDTFKRPIFAGNAFTTVKYTAPISSTAPRVMTVRATSFAPAAASAAPKAAMQAVGDDLLSELNTSASLSQWVGQQVRTSARPELGTAKVVVCGGRALKSAEGFQMLEELADLMSGAVGATRAAVDAGYVPNDLQVGQTGKVIAPMLYMGIGVSGAIQHLAGMKDSKTIVAINNDPEAPIFQVADYGLQQDLFTAVPELIAALKQVARG